MATIMTDENGHRSVPVRDERPGGASYVDAASEMGTEAIRHMAPAATGWILAAVILMLGLTAMILGTNYMSNAARSKSIADFFVMVESNRAEENRRLQEQNETLANAIARQSDRIGRKAVDESQQRGIEDTVREFKAQ